MTYVRNPRSKVKNYPHLQIMREFDENSLPNLDVAVLGALELFENEELPAVPFEKFKKPIVLGSGNAEATGRILFRDSGAIFADEGNYKERLSVIDGFECAVLMSATGSREAANMAKDLKEKGIVSYLLTNNGASESGEFIDDNKIFVFPKNREPHTYNVSTYMSMILVKTGEDPRMIKDFLLGLEDFDFSRYDSFYFLIPEQFEETSPMFRRKFDEIFGPKVASRVFTLGQTAHGHTVVESDRELFVGIGVRNDHFGLENNRLDIELPSFADFTCVMALGYYLIGKIQAQRPPYFKDSVEGYVKRIAKVFGKEPRIIAD